MVTSASAPGTIRFKGSNLGFLPAKYGLWALAPDSEKNPDTIFLD